MLEAYPIIDIPAEAREDVEQLGSKPKFWVSRDDGRWLFKVARPNTGEDWAEKVAAEFAKRIDMHAAEVELAAYVGKRGCISRNFIRTQIGEALIHGNEVLAVHVEGYDKAKIAKQSDHTMHNIITAVSRLFPDGLAAPVLRTLAEYMVFDALIGNTDRHHENWGLNLQLGKGQDSPTFVLSVAPSFDHASSLGRECLDVKAAKLLKENAVARYVNAGRGGVYWQQTDAHGASPLALVKLAAAKYPKYFAPALEKICKLNEDEAWQMISRIPDHLASDVSKQLAHAIVVYSLSELKRIET
jgi:HipA-like C-terminal domain